MEIIQNFGVNPYLLGAQILNFLILLYLLKRFAYKPLFAMLKKRKETIEAGLQDAEANKAALDRTLLEEKKVLRQAQTQAQQLLVDAKNQADAIIDEARRKTRDQVEAMLTDARKQMQQDTKEMEKKLAVSTAALAIDMVKDAVQGIFTEKEQSEAIAKLTANLRKSK